MENMDQSAQAENKAGQSRRARLRAWFGRGVQKFIITLELFGKNELANHAAAGAYGFLLSAAPVFIMVAIIITRVFGAWPEWVRSLLGEIDALAGEFSIDISLSAILANRRIGIPALVTGVNLIWTARVFALSLQRGTRVVFITIERPSFWRENLLTFGIELAVVIYALTYAVSSRIAIGLVHSAGLVLSIPLLDPLLKLMSLLLPIGGLGILTFLAYRLIPFEHPSPKASFRGTLLCIASYVVVSSAFKEVVNLTRYNLLYGTLGSLLILLANVYFFFIFFYLGSQYAFVEDSFDELIFRHYRRLSKGDERSRFFEKRIFSSPKKLMQKYARSYNDGEYLYHGGDSVKEIYYLIRGSIDLHMPIESGQELLESRVHEGGFVGETEFLLDEARTGSARSRGESLVLCLPPELFTKLLYSDPESAMHVIENLCKRINNTRERITKGRICRDDDQDPAESALIDEEYGQ